MTTPVPSHKAAPRAGEMTPPPVAPGLPSPLRILADSPEAFDLDQAVHVLAGGRDPVDMPFEATLRLGIPLAEVNEVDAASGAISTPLFGLVGPQGTLPRHYTALAAAEQRQRNLALRQLMELLARRFTGMWVKAGSKYRPTRYPALTEQILDALVGLATPGLATQLPIPISATRYHAGHLAARSRSAERLAALIEEETGVAVEIIEFAGGWLRLPTSEQTRLGSPLAALGASAVAGAQVWDPQARFIIRLGPLDATTFDALLPSTPLHTRLNHLVRLHVGPEQDFVFNPVLRAGDVPVARLSGTGARLGLTSWLGAPRPRRHPAADAVFRPLFL